LKLPDIGALREQRGFFVAERGVQLADANEDNWRGAVIA